MLWCCRLGATLVPRALSWSVCCSWWLSSSQAWNFFWEPTYGVSAVDSFESWVYQMWLDLMEMVLMMLQERMVVVLLTEGLKRDLCYLCVTLQVLNWDIHFVDSGNSTVRSCGLVFTIWPLWYFWVGSPLSQKCRNQTRMARKDDWVV